MPTFSQSLEQSLHRALAIANERHHQYATLEHLLLSLIDDSDAAAVMRAAAEPSLVSKTTPSTEEERMPQTIPEGFHTLNPYLAVDDADTREAAVAVELAIARPKVVRKVALLGMVAPEGWRATTRLPGLAQPVLELPEISPQQVQLADGRMISRLLEFLN